MTKFLILIVIMQLKHFLADYPLQTPYMLGKFKGGWDWVKPLAAHSGVHALFTFAIALGAHSCACVALGVAALDFIIHFTMDRVKASPNMLGRFKALSANEYPYVAEQAKLINDEDPVLKSVGIDCTRKLQSNVYFWWALGFDQMVHGLTDILVVAILCGAF